MQIQTYGDLKAAIRKRLGEHGISRSRFAREVASTGELSEFSVVCLLSDAPVIGKREPSFHHALSLARHAGIDLVMYPSVVEPAGAARG